VTYTTDRTGAYRGLLGRPAGKRPVGRSKHIWKDNIKTYLQGVVWRSINCTDLAQGRNRWRDLVDAVMNLWIL
jgi:hypothetical protein